MKPTSFIFIAVSILIMILGLFICSAAQKEADRTGIQIFNSEIAESGDTIFSYTFTDDAVRKISVDVLGADVNIMKTDGDSKIEIINFSDNSYTFSKSNKILSVTNSSNILSMLQFGTGNISFDGLRHYFRSGVKSGAEKKINIYINPEKEYRAVTVALDSGNLNISGLSAECDYNITVNSGSASVSDITSALKFEFSGSNSDIVVDNLSCTSVTSDQHVGSITLNGLTVSEKLNVKTDDGNIDINSLRQLSEYKAKVNTGSGSVTIYGNNYDYGYNDAPDDTSALNFVVKAVTGNITIS